MTDMKVQKERERERENVCVHGNLPHLVNIPST